MTYAGPNSGTFALNSAVTMKMQDAQVPGYQAVLRATLDYESAARAANGRNAFIDATALQVENMMESMGKRLELSLLYGQSGLSTADTSANVSTTRTAVTFTTATWSDATWSGIEGAELNFFDSATGALISSGADAIFSVYSVNVSTKTVLVDGTTTGISALDAATLAGSVVAFYRGARTGASTFNEMPGIDKIITNTGILFNINAADWSLWRGNTYNASGALTFGKLQAAVAIAVGRGLMESVTVYVNPKTWSNLLNDQAGLRMYDSSYSSKALENGAQSLKFNSQNGVLEVVSHPFVKEGEAFIVPLKRLKRLGATEITFKTPGWGGDIFKQLENNAGFEYRTYFNQAIMLETPARAVKITGITNT